MSNTSRHEVQKAHLIWLALQWVQSHVGIAGNKRADQIAKQGAESTQPEVPLTLRRAKSIISTYNDKYTAITQKTKSFGKPWVTLVTGGPIPRHLERAEAVVHFRLTTGHDFLGVFLHTGLVRLLTRSTHSAAMPEWMATICSNALDSMNTRQMASSGGTGRLSAKWSRSQARALDK
ncbi:uncharacterized protein TNCV_4233061 [Trichonephila clavipes]|nr:uncharacterized protein TNCV_4233061 [Trichonephila clavipes]